MKGAWAKENKTRAYAMPSLVLGWKAKEMPSTIVTSKVRQRVVQPWTNNRESHN